MQGYFYIFNSIDNPVSEQIILKYELSSQYAVLDINVSKCKTIANAAKKNLISQKL